MTGDRSDADLFLREGTGKAGEGSERKGKCRNLKKRSTTKKDEGCVRTQKEDVDRR